MSTVVRAARVTVEMRVLVVAVVALEVAEAGSSMAAVAASRAVEMSLIVETLSARTE